MGEDEYVTGIMPRSEKRASRAALERETLWDFAFSMIFQSFAIAFFLAVVLLGAIFGLSGCTTISQASSDGASKALAVVQADLRDWQSLSDDQKKQAHWKVGRALNDVVVSSGGAGSSVFAVDPWDKSSGQLSPNPPSASNGK